MSLENLTPQQLSFQTVDPEDSGFDSFLQLRCPGCRKLYQVNARDLQSGHPHFDCKSCQVTFTFDNPPKNPKMIPTRVVSLAKIQTREQKEKEEVIPELKKCVKCAKLNPKISNECYNCGLVFEKAESVSNEMKQLGALPSLMKAWAELMKDYSNMAKHVAFVDRCEDLQALPFALKKYQELKEIQPQDSLATMMFNSVLFKNISQRAQKLPFLLMIKDEIQKWAQQVNWRKVIKLSPLVLSFVLILLGLLKPGWRNLIGGGVSLLFLTIGLTITIKGRLRLSDFWTTKTEK